MKKGCPMIHGELIFEDVTKVEIRCYPILQGRYEIGFYTDKSVLWISLSPEGMGMLSNAMENPEVVE